MKALVIDDDARVARSLASYLRHRGFGVDLACDFSPALRLLEGMPYDLAIIDWMLPGGRGTELCRHVRAAGSPMALIVVSGFAATDDYLAAIAAGADDFLSKPLCPDELDARLAAVKLRGAWRTESRPIAAREAPRDKAFSGAVLRVGSLELCGDRVSRDGRELDFTPRERQVFEHLARHAERTVTRDELAAHVWGSTAEPVSNVIEQMVLRVRAKLGDGDVSIETRRGRGYRLVVKGS